MIRQILLLMCWILSAQAAATIPERTHDGRARSSCPSWAKNPAIELCSPSLVRIAARAEDYDGRYIKVTGYLAESGSAFYLCPARELCTEDDWSVSVELPRSSLLRGLAKNKFDKKIVVVGKFSASTRGSRGQVAGVFEALDTAYEAGGASPPDPKVAR